MSLKSIVPIWTSPETVVLVLTEETGERPDACAPPEALTATDWWRQRRQGFYRRRLRMRS